MAEDLNDLDIDLDTDKIRDWRSIITLIVFILTNVVVLFPFHIPIPFPRILENAVLDALSRLRVISPRHGHSQDGTSSASEHSANQAEDVGFFVWLSFPMNFVTAPLIADLFLLAILAIGRDEVYGGTIGANNISPIDIMVFFITLAYIAISIDASGLIKYLAFKVLQKGGKFGHRLFFYLYAFFFGLGTFVGNDPIILSGTAFLSYMTHVSSNIAHPRAWIFAQFAVANIASAILVSSNPTNLVLAGAFDIRFIDYTANMIVPVVITTIILFPFLLYIVFADESLIPTSIQMHELSEEAKSRKPVNPNIPYARGSAEDSDTVNGEESKNLSLEEIMNPFVDKRSAIFGVIVMAATLVTVLALNAASESIGEHPVFYVTLPAAVVMFCWDMAFGWLRRDETRKIARDGRRKAEQARTGQVAREIWETERSDLSRQLIQEHQGNVTESQFTSRPARLSGVNSMCEAPTAHDEISADLPEPKTVHRTNAQDNHFLSSTTDVFDEKRNPDPHKPSNVILEVKGQQLCQGGMDAEKQPRYNTTTPRRHEDATLVSLVAKTYMWAQETFPTATAVLNHLPFALVPFAFSMFVLVQALVTKGWVQVFAYGWNHWVNLTGTVGSVGGMAFLSVVLCNFAGTNIGTTILLSRVIQAWQKIHQADGTDISDRTFWATVYSMALGVNYGAFSTAFSASLAGLLWRDILARKHIHVRRTDFARVNLPIISVTMIVGCAVLIGEVYIIRSDAAYVS